MVFVSKYLGYKQWIKPARYHYDNFGQRTYIAGLAIRFTDGRYETKDPEIIEALMGNPVYGVDYWALDEKGNKILEREKTPEQLEEEKKEQEANETTALVCPTCGLRAQNLQGLKAHMRAKHNQSGPTE